MAQPIPPLIESITRVRAEVESDARLRSQVTALQRWQVARLLQTYADFRAQPQFADAIDFFVHDLYGPHDQSRRDRDLQRVVETWQRLLPDRALDAVAAALELEARTQQLDLKVVAAIGAGIIDASTYARAYRVADRRDERERQIALIVECGAALESLVVKPWVGRALQAAKIPARLAGVGVLHRFLEHGYASFLKMGGARPLLAAIEERETTIMRNLFAAQRDPFRFAKVGPQVELLPAEVQ